MTKWKSGPPPSLGWWPCRLKDRPYSGCLRWWDGKLWSWCALPSDSAEIAAWFAEQSSPSDRRLVQWSARPDSWPERSRT